MQKRAVNRKFEDFEVKIAEKALGIIERESFSSPYTETGGVVAGSGNFLDNNLILTDASLPGPRAIRKRTLFQRDHLFCQNFLDDLAINSNGSIDYLGEWHKHFEDDPKPSHTDIRTLTLIAQSPNYHVSVPLGLIIGRSNLRSALRVFAFLEDGSFQTLKWAVI